MPVSGRKSLPESGALLKHERLPARLHPSRAAAGYRIFYRGMGFDGTPTLVTGSVFLPHGRPPRDGWPVVSFAHGTVGLHHRASPSRAGLSRPERAHVDGWLAHGYAVAATDYEGMRAQGVHPYFNGEAVADDIVDAVRAAHGLGARLGLALSRRWLLAGFSQGGHAALHTAVIADSYAPELDFRGTAVFGPAIGLRRLLTRLTADPGAPAAWLTPIFLAGLRVSDPDLSPQDFLTPQGIQLLGVAERATLKEMIASVAGVTNDAAGFTGIVARAGLGELLDRLDMPLARLGRPVHLSAGGRDDIAPAAALEPFVHQLRAVGNQVGFHACPVSDHVAILSSGLPQAIAWAGELMAPTAAGATATAARFAQLDCSRDGELTRADFTVFALRLVQAAGHAPRSAQALRVREGYARLWRGISGGNPGICGADYARWTRLAGGAGFAEAVEPLAISVIRLAGGEDSLSRTELIRLLLACGLTPERARQEFAALDRDGSGRVSRGEIIESIRRYCRGAAETGGWLFGRA